MTESLRGLGWLAIGLALQRAGRVFLDDPTHRTEIHAIQPNGPATTPNRDRHVWALQNHKSPERGSSLVRAIPSTKGLRESKLTPWNRKIPWRLSPTQKARQRKRLRAVDLVIETVSNALAKKGETLKSLDRWKAEMPTEAQMLPKDKYTMFDRKAKRYRKGIHSTSSSWGWKMLRVVWLTI